MIPYRTEPASPASPPEASPQGFTKNTASGSNREPLELFTLHPVALSTRSQEHRSTRTGRIRLERVGLSKGSEGVEATVQSRTEDDRSPDKTGETVIPLLAEEIEVSRQVVETGRVQVARVTHEREQLIDELLTHQTVEIDRIPVGRQIDTMPTIREEGDIVVIPIVEEVLVIERRLLLKEEVRVRRVRSTERHQESVTLRHHEAVVTRVPVEPPAAGERPEASATPQQPNQEG
jgi:uncharacterized protein (TIGR02271 family)